MYISNCPAGHHRPWAWDVGMSGCLVVWLVGCQIHQDRCRKWLMLALKATKLEPKIL